MLFLRVIFRKKIRLRKQIFSLSFQLVQSDIPLNDRYSFGGFMSPGVNSDAELC